MTVRPDDRQPADAAPDADVGHGHGSPNVPASAASEPNAVGASATELDHDHPLSAVAGVLATAVIRDLARPLWHLRENLAGMLDSIERHVSASGGPDPLPWTSLNALREGLADVYLLARETARLASDLNEVMGVGRSHPEPQPVDVNRQVEAALVLTRPRFREDTELFVDLGSVPPVRAVGGELALIVAKLLLCCADSAATHPGSAVSVHTRYERTPGQEAVVIAIADNGAGIPGVIDSARRALEPVLGRLGGRFDGICEPGVGCAFECVFPLDHRAPARSGAPGAGAPDM